MNKTPELPSIQDRIKAEDEDTDVRRKRTPVYRYNPILNRNIEFICYSQIDKPRVSVYRNLLEVLAEVLKSRVKNHHQNVIGVVGRTGSGKSTLGYWLAKLIDPYCNLAEIYIYDNKDLAAKLEKDPSEVSPVNFLDEGSVILNSNRHATREATDITVIFDTMRSRGMSTICCVPELRSLNNRIRDDHMDFLIVCGERSPIFHYSKRGFFKLFVKTRPSTFSNKVYWKCVGWGIFKPLTPKMDREYQEYKRKAQERLLEKFYKNYGEAEEETDDGDY